MDKPHPLDDYPSLKAHAEAQRVYCSECRVGQKFAAADWYGSTSPACPRCGGVLVWPNDPRKKKGTADGG